MSKIINCGILGAAKTGKSSIINMFLQSYFEESYMATIENKCNKLYSYKNNLYTISCNDTAGQEEYSCLVPDTISNCQCFIIVYSLNDRESIDKIQLYKDLIKSNYKGNYLTPPIILVANKSDKKNVITKNEIIELSKVFDIPTITSSSNNLASVLSIFNLLIDTIEYKDKQKIKNLNIIKCEVFLDLPIIKDFSINKEIIKIKTDINSVYYSNWTLYSDIEFTKVSLTIIFHCQIIDQKIRECIFESNQYKNQLNAYSIDACLLSNQKDNQDSKCGVVLSESVHPYPIITNISITSDGNLKLKGYYLNFDIHYMLWTGNETNEIIILKNKDHITDNEIVLNFSTNLDNNNKQLFLIINWNYNKPILINTLKIKKENIQSIDNLVILNNNNNKNNNNNNNNNNNKDIEIINVNKDLSDFSSNKGILVINGNRIKGNISVQVGELFCPSVIILDSSMIRVILPDGVGDGKLIPIKVFLEKKILNTENILFFTYKPPDIKFIEGLSRDGGEITIYGSNFNKDLVIIVGTNPCSSPRIIFKRSSYKSRSQVDLDEITCYVGPIHNESIEYTHIKLIYNGISLFEKKSYYQLSPNEINPYEDDIKSVKSSLSPFYTLTNVSVLIILLSLFIVLLKRKSIIPKLYSKNK
ncbi:hypothetical protein RB653_004877 [Dictyostelium firmibasis]|uniref:Uncharacterized protein n=1 Tax=Dictyostelium firmibasis TaxID=79012 RepID=A0AAN7U8C6_9MYCE